MIEISQALMYVLFSFLIGLALLSIVSDQYRPLFIVKNSWVYSSICIIPLLSLVPVLSVSYYIHVQYEAPFVSTLTQVVLGYKMGQAWMVTMLLAIILVAIYYYVDYARTFFAKMLFFVFLLASTVSTSWASHAASLEEAGFLYNGMHFIAATVWMGTIFVISWFASEKNIEKWSSFIRWFSPISIGAMAILIISGLLLMTIIVPEYVNSWVLSYGQLLLLKHLLIIPILVFGVVHGFLLRKRLQKFGISRFRNTLKAESVVGLFIFVITAIMTERVPPHEVARTLQMTEPSYLFQWITGEHIGSIVPLTFTINVLSISLLILSAILLSFVIFEVLRGKGWIRITFLCTLFALVTMVGLVVSTQPSSEGWIDDQRFSSPLEAIQSEYDGNVEVLVERQVGNELLAVVYHIDDDKLAANLLYKEGEDFYKVNESNLMIGGIPISELDHKIRTFIIRNGPWLEDDQPFTYVTIGHIREPGEVEKVAIYFEGDTSETIVENNTFINIISADEEWDPNHPIEFFNKDEEVIGGYMRGFLEEGVYCH
ncbi:copper resistance D family protein [Alkalihalobacterium alkalinitrilicum]|uniref:copper resistance D family protein n=1 Tax=Alkalihalobacterium alkalinitrilicum TaxID=427920 RepID=UPI000995509F|nr:CopD family protein [Alkalihalobacterium alkalinitrilicum]